MKYIIMCGGKYRGFQKPRQLLEVDGEPIVARIIRLLRECGVTDVAISSNLDGFEDFGVPVLKHDNHWEVFGYNNSKGNWANGFYPTNEQVCYIFGDVVFSKAAIKKIVETQTNSIEFFASAPPFSEQYHRVYAEPFGFKVVDIKYFWECVEKFKEYKATGKFARDPMSWELWQIIKKTPLNKINYKNYTVINDYTCDVDSYDDIKLFEGIDLEA